jgi:hypothetical protein
MPVFDWHPSEATALLVAAGRGLRGDVEIRGDGHRVRLTDQSTNVYTLARTDVLGLNEPARAALTSRTMDEVEAFVRAVCGDFELDYERQRADDRNRMRAEPSPIGVALRAVDD